MAKPHSDPISPWFVAAEDLGEFIGIRFGQIASGQQQPSWSFLSHKEVDGIGGFAQLLRQRGAKLPHLPQIQHPSRPSRLKVLRLAPKFLLPQYKVAWAPMSRGPALQDTRQPPPAVAWHVFSDATTTQIRRICRKTRVTVNSLLIKNLAKSLRPFLQDQSADVPLMVPVNLRGKIVRDSDTDNYSSYVAIRVKSYDSVRDVHQRIYRALNRGDHWANWYGYELGRLLTHNLRRFLIKTGRCMSQWNLGSFSNLGDWDSDRAITAPACAGPWLFSPPVLRCQLLGAGCVTFQNRLSLTLHAHPDLTTDPAVPAAWMQHWIKEIEMDVTSIASDPSFAAAFPGVAA